MDNFSSHKVEGVGELIESVGAQLIYLPPYFPDFSPIEYFWSKVKQHVRSAARTAETFDQAITDAFEAVSLEALVIALPDSDRSASAYRFPDASGSSPVS